MKNLTRIFSILRHVALTVFAVAAVVPANGQQSFFKKYSGPQPVLGGWSPNTGLTAGAAGYFSTSIGTLVETDLNGDVQWGRKYNYSLGEFAVMSIELRTGGGYCVGGNSYEPTQQGTYVHNFVLRLDASGNTLWAKKLQLNLTNTEVMAVSPTADGGFGICASYGITNGQGGAWIGKTDSLGNLLWGKLIRHGSLAVVKGSSIIATRDGGFVVTSKVLVSNSTVPHSGFSRLDANGNLLWTKTFSGAGPNDWPSVTQCADGGFAIGGSCTDGTGEGFRLIRTDSLGNQLWTSCFFSMPAHCYAKKIHETANHGFILAGNYLDLATLDQYPLVVCTDSIGDTCWTRKMVFPAVYGAYPHDVQQTPDGGFLVSAADLTLIKTDPHGDISCVSYSANVTCLDTLVSQTSSLDFVSFNPLIPATITSTLLPFTDTTFCTGKFAPTGITAHDATDELVVYPNPSEGLFTLQIENDNASYDVAVYNVIGQVVRRYKNASSQLVIDLTAADAGIYVVRVIGDPGKHIRSVKLLKR